MDSRVREIIDKSKNIVFFGGAGVSTESGIPDFRSETGLYNAVMKYGYPPEYIISRPFFDRHTEKFFQYYKENLIYPRAKPNKAHIALAKLEEEGKLRGIITQNIDGLHQMAGSKNVCELHGTVQRNICMDCGTKFHVGYIMDDNNCEYGVPKCSKCGGIIKPDVVLYEEQLDDKNLKTAIEWISEADTLIVGGTSLIVYPAAGLVEHFKGDNLILINKSETGYDDKATLVINEAIGEVLGD